MDASVLIVVAMISGVVGPGILALLTTRAQAQARREDWARQDAIADRQEKAAAANGSRLDEIHTLVNSNLTDAQRRELAATQAMLVTMREVVDLKRAGGLEPGPQSLQAIEMTQMRVDALEHDLERKLQQTEAAAAQRDRADKRIG